MYQLLINVVTRTQCPGALVGEVIIKVCVFAGESPTMLRTEIRNQRKRIQNVKKKSLWSRSLEEVALLIVLLLSVDT